MVYRQKGVSGVTTCAGSLYLRHASAIAEGSSKLGALSGGPPLSLFDMLLTTKVGLGT